MNVREENPIRLLILADTFELPTAVAENLKSPLPCGFLVEKWFSAQPHEHLFALIPFAPISFFQKLMDQ